MTDADTATALAALGHEARLKLFRLLVRAGHEGLSIGAIQGHLDIPASTLAHHLRALVDAGLVHQTRAGRSTLCRADYDRMNGVLAHVAEACCAGIGPDFPMAADAIRPSTQGASE
ncbi:MAG: metalloregulator ArsR/SmtB family transcription factor [Pseudomonadota bacterium]